MEKICTTRISQKGRKCTKPELPKCPAKRKESQNKIENKTTGTKAVHELAKRHVRACPFKMGEHQSNNSQAICKADNSWLY